jgi:hypothetical protein
MNCELFIKFMEQIIEKSNGKKVYLIVDNLRVHHGKLVKEFLKKISDKIEIFYLPAYFPTDNPAESSNNTFKRRARQVELPNIQAKFTGVADSTLFGMQQNKKLILEQFNKKETKYIPEMMTSISEKYAKLDGLEKIKLLEIHNERRPESLNYAKSAIQKFEAKAKSTAKIATFAKTLGLVVARAEAAVTIAARADGKDKAAAKTLARKMAVAEAIRNVADRADAKALSSAKALKRAEIALRKAQEAQAKSASQAPVTAKAPVMAWAARSPPSSAPRKVPCPPIRSYFRERVIT